MKVVIDLGTASSSLAYMDERERGDQDLAPIRILEIPQLVASGQTESRETLPSFLLLEDDEPVGVYARENGSLTPTRLVHSVKLWLANPDIDRTEKILPWDAPDAG